MTFAALKIKARFRYQGRQWRKVTVHTARRESDGRIEAFSPGIEVVEVGP